jgi:carbonic anhydrase
LAIMGISTDELVQRNSRFAAAGAFAGLPFPTNHTLRVVGCVDSRVDPSHVLGLAPGDAVVMRNIGGRVTPATLRSWALPEQLAGYFEIPVADLEGKAVGDPYAAVRIDMDIARRTLPPSLLVSGLEYDVNTGLIEIVVPPAE